MALPPTSANALPVAANFVRTPSSCSSETAAARLSAYFDKASKYATRGAMASSVRFLLPPNWMFGSGSRMNRSATAASLNAVSSRWISPSPCLTDVDAPSRATANVLTASAVGRVVQPAATTSTATTSSSGRAREHASDIGTSPLPVVVPLGCRSSRIRPSRTASLFCQKKGEKMGGRPI